MKLIISLFLIQFSAFSYGQYYTVKGRVFDISGNIISYAAITSSRTHETFPCNKEGFFSFQTPYKYDTLICTHISFQKQIQVLSENDTVNFIMVPNDTFLYSIKLQDANINKPFKTEDSVLIKEWLALREAPQDSSISCELTYRDVEVAAKYKTGKNGFKNDFERIYDSLNYPKFTGVIKA